MSALLRVGAAGPKGKGLFAKRSIPEGRVVLSFRSKARWIWDIPKGLWQYVYQVDYDRYLLPHKNSYGRFLNHSCRPNCFFDGLTSVVTLRDISEGEEVTFDYSTNVGWDGFAMECRCGERNCRRVIRSYRHLSEEQKRAYGARVSRYLLRPEAGRPPRMGWTPPWASPSPSARPAFSASSNKHRTG